MKESISVIIVTYQSSSYIANCLSTLTKASDTLSIEVIVVDNDSRDSTASIIKTYFPEVIYIQNHDNIGFGAACNQGVELSTGDFLFFLNPDTIVCQGLWEHMQNAYDSLEDVGILSPALLDSRGNFLPESARRVPTLASALGKALGIGGMASQYYHPIDSNNPIQSIEIASGAAMMISKALFTSIGGFDERYFMFAEDIDISYRMLQAGYRNYLVSEARVIHLKGESTNKASWAYNRYFYSTMSAFVRKYAGHLYPFWQVGVVKIATFILSGFFFLMRWIHKYRQAIGDVFLGIAILMVWQFFWSLLRHGEWHFFGYFQYMVIYLLVASIWVLCMVGGGTFWAAKEAPQTHRALWVGVILTWVLYALAPPQWRFSRMIMFGGGITMIWIKSWMSQGERRLLAPFTFIHTQDKQADIDAFVISLIHRSNGDLIHVDDIGALEATEGRHILLATDGHYDPVAIMMYLGTLYRYSFIHTRTNQLISSFVSSTQGLRIDPLSHHHLYQQTYLYQKRVLDIIILLLLTIPLIVFQVLWLRKITLVQWRHTMQGHKTIVGYDHISGEQTAAPCKPYLLTYYNESDDIISIQQKIMQYSLHYSIFDDIFVIMSRFNYLLKALTYGSS